MTDWPSEEGMFWLILGLFPVGYVMLRVLQRGIVEMANLSVGFVILNWLGYHATPWLALRTGGWDSFLLRPDYVIDGLIFSTLGMLAFLIGYRESGRVRRESRPGGLVRFRQILANSTPRVKWIIVLAATSFFFLLINVGGIDELLESSLRRGEGQFDERTFAFSVKNIIKIFSGAVHCILALVSSLAIFSPRNRGVVVIRVAGLFGLVMAILPFAHGFSRVAGFPLVLAAFVALVFRGWRKAMPIAVVFFIIGGWLSWTGYTQRGNFLPGIGTFITAMIAVEEPADPRDGGSHGVLDDPGMNPLNALDAFTARAWSKGFVDAVTVKDGLIGVLAALQPIPSHIVPFEVSAGETLTVVLGTDGSVGLTTPALAELYYWFGFSGALVLVPFGRLCRWIDRRRESGNSTDLVLWGGTILGLVIGLHSGIRAMTRFTFYALAMIAFTEAACWLQRRKGLAATHMRHLRTKRI